MSQSNIHAKIGDNPGFAELVGKAHRFAIALSLIIVLVPYYSYMLLVSLQPQLFAGKISEGSVITIGGPIAALIVVAGRLLTGAYACIAPTASSTPHKEEVLKREENEAFHHRTGSAGAPLAARLPRWPALAMKASRSSRST